MKESVTQHKTFSSKSVMCDSIWKNLCEQSELCVTVHNNLDEALPDPGDMPIHTNKHKLCNSETPL